MRDNHPCIWRKPLQRLALLPFLIASSAYAEQSTSNNDTNALVVEGSWLGSSDLQDVKTYPGARSIVTESDIKNSGATDIQNALMSIPSVRIQDETAGTGILPNISVRGLNPLRSVDLQVLVDGIPLALGPYSATGLSLFPVSLDMVKKIDIVRGGAAVQYGPNNVGGVINIITKPIPTDYESVIGQTTTAAPTGKLLSNSYLRTGGFLSDNFGAQFQANFTRGSGDREHSNTNVDNFLVNFDYWPTQSTEVKSSLQYYHADAELPGALTPEQYADNWRQFQTPNNQYQSESYRASVVLQHDFDNNSQFTWMNYYNKNRRNFIWQSPLNAGQIPTAMDQSPRTYQTFGTEPSYSFIWDDYIKQKFIIGARYLYEDIFYPVYSQEISSGATTTKRQWSSNTNAIAAYVSDTFYFINDRLQITPGVRVESVYQNFTDELNHTNDKTNNMTKLLPGLTIGFQANKNIYLFANAQRSLLPPQMTQVANSNGSSLTAELANNYEVGTRTQITKELHTNITLFRTDFDNKIEKINSIELANVGKSVQQGIETQLTYSPVFIKGLDFTLGYTYLDAEIQEGENAGNRLPYTSRNQFSIISNYNYHSWNYNISGYYLSSAFSDPENTPIETSDGTQGPIPAYWLWNVSVNKTTQLSTNTELSISFSIHNLFNEQYYFRNVDVSGGITPAPGRAFVLGAQLKF